MMLLRRDRGPDLDEREPSPATVIRRPAPGGSQSGSQRRGPMRQMARATRRYSPDVADSDAGVNLVELSAAEFEQFAAALDGPAELKPALVVLFQRSSRIPSA